jgi:hypothetical protein
MHVPFIAAWCALKALYSALFSRPVTVYVLIPIVIICTSTPTSTSELLK